MLRVQDLISYIDIYTGEGPRMATQEDIDSFFGR